MSSSAVTLLLDRMRQGEEGVESELMAVVYDELRRMAADRIGIQPRGELLQPTELVNEAYLKLASPTEAWEGRAHFFGAAARAMRHILVDQIRRQSRLRRGAGRQAQPLDTQFAEPQAADADQVLDIEELLVRLEASQPRAARIVDLRFFVGLSEDDTAQALGLSARTVYRDWAYAKAWLRRELADPRVLDDERP
jgi:RNA polymerase sigma factor (TIGR02999 family)